MRTALLALLLLPTLPVAGCSGGSAGQSKPPAPLAKPVIAAPATARFLEPIIITILNPAGDPHAAAKGSSTPTFYHLEWEIGLAEPFIFPQFSFAGSTIETVTPAFASSAQLFNPGIVAVRAVATKGNQQTASDTHAILVTNTPPPAPTFLGAEILGLTKGLRETTLLDAMGFGALMDTALGAPVPGFGVYLTAAAAQHDLTMTPLFHQVASGVVASGVPFTVGFQNGRTAVLSPQAIATMDRFTVFLARELANWYGSAPPANGSYGAFFSALATDPTPNFPVYAKIIGGATELMLALTDYGLVSSPATVSNDHLGAFVCLAQVMAQAAGAFGAAVAPGQAIVGQGARGAQSVPDLLGAYVVAADHFGVGGGNPWPIYGSLAGGGATYADGVGAASVLASTIGKLDGNGNFDVENPLPSSGFWIWVSAQPSGSTYTVTANADNQGAVPGKLIRLQVVGSDGYYATFDAVTGADGTITFGPIQAGAAGGYDVINAVHFKGTAQGHTIAVF